MHISRIRARMLTRNATGAVSKSVQAALLVCGLLGIASAVLVSVGTIASPNPVGMSRTLKPVLTPASDAITAPAWHAGQRTALTFRSANSAAAAVHCVFILDRVVRFRPSPGALYLQPDPCSVHLTHISHGPVRNAHRVPTSVGVSRELRYSSRAGAFAPAGRFPSRLRRVTFSQIQKFVRRSG